MKKYFLLISLVFLCAAEAKGLEAGTIRAGDELTLDVSPAESLSGSFTVDSFGKIHHPVLGEIFAASLTPEELEEYLTEDLRKGYDNPKVEIKFADRPEASVMITGQVLRPGSYALTPDLTFLKLISRAGGFMPAAATQNVGIVRKAGEFTVMKIDADSILDGRSPDFKLEARDLILVKEKSS